MNRMPQWLVLAMVMVIGVGARLADAEDAAQKLYDTVTPSLVVVQYNWENELNKTPLAAAGIVVSKDGLVVTSLGVFSDQIPDKQMKDFKIIIPRQNGDPEELKATFEGRDERTNLAFLKAAEPRKDKKPWIPLTFEDDPVSIGDRVSSVGLLPKVVAYKTYYMAGTVATTLRGEVPQVLVGEGLCAPSSPVFNADGKAIGMVAVQNAQSLLINNPEALVSIQMPPKLFVPASDFLISLSDPPSAGHPLKLPWIGIPEMTGLSKDVANAFGLTDQPAIQVGDVIEDTPAAKAGLKQGDIIVKVNGKPLERGDSAEELPAIFRRRMLRYKPGDKVTFSVLREKGQPLIDIPIVLGQQPPQANTADRYWADDMGFGVRDIVLLDTYPRHLPRDQKGVIVTVLRKSSAAENAGLHSEDLITQLNGQPVTDEKQFATDYGAFRKAKPHEAVVLVVLRDGQETTIRIEPPQ
ncbi:MAG TPA: PDZ domain-containing protein [Tepidisphaeraceae bacterium]|jgi:serine protease Do|nr:PDZ domain-containing protein [Tepidisphaeraceae bacterium]